MASEERVGKGGKGNREFFCVHLDGKKRVRKHKQRS